MEQKPAACSYFFPYKPKGECRRAKAPHVEKQRLWGIFRIGRDKAKSRWFSKSKSVCTGWSGNVPRLCAIWTPQCGGMKGKWCFIKRKSKDLVSNYRRLCEKNVSIFEERAAENVVLQTNRKDGRKTIHDHRFGKARGAEYVHYRAGGLYQGQL